MRDPRLGRLAAPQPRPSFHDELWERVEAAERAATRRWRRTSIALAVVAVSAVVAATALAATLASSPHESVIGETLSCATTLQGQRPVVSVQANVKTRQIPVASLAVLTTPGGDVVVAGSPNQVSQQLAVAAAKDGFGVDDATCAPSHRRVPLAAAGLPASTTITTTFLGSFWQSCAIADRARADRALLHVHVTLAGGVPTRAELAIRNEATNKPIAYVVWTPTRVSSFFAQSCKVFH
jgi:hypothetical protein